MKTQKNPTGTVNPFGYSRWLRYVNAEAVRFSSTNVMRDAVIGSW